MKFSTILVVLGTLSRVEAFPRSAFEVADASEDGQRSLFARFPEVPQTKPQSSVANVGGVRGLKGSKSKGSKSHHHHSSKGSSKLSSKSAPPPEHSSKSSPPPPEHSSKSAPPPVEHSSKSAPPPPPPTSSPPGSSKSPDYGKGKGYYPPPPPGKGKGYYPPPEGKGKGYYPPPEGKGKGYYPPPVSSSKTPGKGKGYYPPPGKGKGYYPPPVPTCQIIPITFYLDDLRAGYNSTRVGTSFDTVPFYDSNNGEQLGFYSDESTLLNSGDCVGSGAFSFGSEPYTSQINFQFTCNGEFNTVTGGSGNYGCASGYEAPISQDDLIIQSQLTLCGPLCPYTPPSE